MKHKCPLCDKRFPTQKARNKHQREHAGKVIVLRFDRLTLPKKD